MSPSRGDHRLILASGSPRRRELLEMLGLPFGVIVPAVDETRKTSELPDRYVVRVARDKALAVARQEPGAVVLAADTAVVLRAEEVFGKPRSPEEAVAMLQPLEGRTDHETSRAATSCASGGTGPSRTPGRSRAGWCWRRTPRWCCGRRRCSASRARPRRRWRCCSGSRGARTR